MMSRSEENLNGVRHFNKSPKQKDFPITNRTRTIGTRLTDDSLGSGTNNGTSTITSFQWN